MADDRWLVDEIERITHAIVAGDDLETTLARVVDGMRAATGAARCSIMLRSGDRLRIRAAHGLPAHVVEHVSVPVGEGIAGGVAASGTARLLRDAESAPGALAGVSLYAGASALCVPLRAGGEVIGVVNLASKRPGAAAGEAAEFDEADLRTAALLAGQAGMAIAHARAAERQEEHERLQATLATLQEQIVGLEAQGGALAVIRQVTDSLVSEGDLDEILHGIVRHTTRLLGCRRGSLLLREPDSPWLRMQAAVGIPERIVRRSRTEIGRGLAGRCAETGEPLLVTDVDAIRSEVEGLEPRSGDYRGKSAICVPLFLRGEVLGVLNLNDRKDGQELGPSDLFVARIVANQAALAIRNGELREEAVSAANARQALRVAQEIQQSFLPEDVRADGLAVAARSIACAGAGGDYVDFWPRRTAAGVATGEWALVIGDVSGHDVGAALVMATTRAFLRGLLSQSSDLPTVLERLNELLGRDVRHGRFVTLFVGLVNPASGVLRYASAGHDPPLLRRARDGACVELGATGPPLAVLPEAEFPECSVAVAEGDWLVLTTDGAWELRNEAGEPFGRERLAKAVDQLAGETPERLLAGLGRRVLGFGGATQPDDDIGLAAVRFGPATAPPDPARDPGPER